MLVGAAAAAALLRAGSGPIRDIDYYWHLLVGQDVLQGVAVQAAGRGWSFAPVEDDWVSTQWLSEVVFAALESPFGLSSALVFRVITTAISLAVLAWITLHGRPQRSGSWVFAIIAVQLAIVAQERSQQITFILAPLVGWWGWQLWREGKTPRWWVILPVVWLWSQFHGGWVLAPAVLALGALARTLDQRRIDPSVVRATWLAIGCALVSLVSPAGVGTISAARRFSEATGAIVEWQPVELWAWSSLPLAIAMLIVVVAWSRGPTRPSVGELVIVITMFVFAVAAYRNVTPALMVLAPFIVGALARALGETDPVAPDDQARRWRKLAWGIAAAAGIAAVVAAATTPNVVDPKKVPLRLISQIAAAENQRVLNAYNVSGPLLWFGGPPPNVTVAVDGRADRYGADYLERYQEMEAGLEGWDLLVNELAPTSALLQKDKPLAELLRARGWVEVDREADYVLLHAPGVSGWND